MLGLAGAVTALSRELAPLVVAPFVGSFLGVLIERLPAEQSVVFGRSACVHCGATLAPRELVPLASYLLQRGRCRRCGAPIGRFYLSIELAATGVAALAVLASNDARAAWTGCILGWALLSLAWIDWRWMQLPDVLTLPLVLAGLLLTLLLDPAAAPLHAVGAAAGYLSLRSVAWCYRLLRGRDGMGAGDAKLLAAAGAWLGPAALPLVILLSAVLGIAMAGALAISGRRMTASTALPFGTCLATAFWLVWLHGNWLAGGGVMPWTG